jgi:signal transduction histidine kinase
MRIISRYLVSAIGVALILLAVNFVVFFAYLFKQASLQPENYSVSQVAEGLTLQNGAYQLSDSTETILEEQYQWAMLLDDMGKVIWSRNLPAKIPQKFTVSEVASFSRWYLDDYPVYVWQLPDGLFVLGGRIDSVWKYNLEYPMAVFENIFIWIPIFLFINALLALAIALVFGLRLFHSLKPLAGGIRDMSEKKAVKLPTKGLLGEFAAGINKASAHLVEQDIALDKRDTARTQWIAAVSHDIRTPLSLVMGYASELEENLRLSKSEREQAGIIRRQSQRIKSLLNDLNLTSKLEYDMQPLRLGPVFLPGLVRRVGADFLNNVGDGPYRIDVEIEESAQPAEIVGDEALLTRVLSNLLNNSLQHNPDGCSIQIVLEGDDPFYVITVRDDGVGFTEQQCGSFNQDSPGSEQPESGLGLLIVRQVLRAHGGRTACRNLPAGGCEVKLYMRMMAGQGDCS